MVSVSKEVVPWKAEYVKDFYEIVADDVIEIYSDSLEVLKKGIMAGISNLPLALLSMTHFADLMHGGAYTVPTWELPYYSPQTKMLGSAGRGGSDLYTLPDGKQIVLPPQAKPEQIEIILNSNAPHRFPKFLSDQAYYLQKEWMSLFNTTSLLGNFATAVHTVVNGDDLGRGGDGGGGRRKKRGKSPTALMGLAGKVAEAVGD